MILKQRATLEGACLGVGDDDGDDEMSMETNLSGANITAEQLEQAKTFESSEIPDNGMWIWGLGKTSHD